MKPTGSKKNDDGGVSAITNLEMAINGVSSNLWGSLRADDGDGGLFQLTLKRDPDGGWFAIAKRSDPADGSPQVLFADGDSFAGTLSNLGRAICKGKWRADKPWKGPGTAS